MQMHHLMKHWNGDSLGLRTSSTSKGLWPWPLFLLAIGIHAVPPEGYFLWISTTFLRLGLVVNLVMRVG